MFFVFVIKLLFAPTVVVKLILWMKNCFCINFKTHLNHKICENKYKVSQKKWELLLLLQAVTPTFFWDTL